jgi:hypothetical protein
MRLFRRTYTILQYRGFTFVSGAACLHCGTINGPELPFVSATVRCGAARQTSHSLQVQKLSWPNSHSSDKVPNNSDQPTSAFLLKPSI